MRGVWRIVLLGAIGLGVMFAAAARLCRLDPMTTRMPHPIRSVVATLAVYENSIGPNALDRALRIDSENAAAWSRRCTAYVGRDAGQRLEDCQRAVVLRRSAANLRAEASAQEESGDFCAAQASYHSALRTLLRQRAYVMRDEARAALACGDLSGSLAALKLAEAFDKDNSEELEVDRGYMAVVYERLNQPEMAQAMCSAANPGYGSCACKLTGSAVSCSQTVAAAK